MKKIELNYSILREVGTLARSIGAINDVKYAGLSLNKNQYIFLTRICENEGISFKDLTIMLRVDKATTTTAIQKLIKNDYVRKEKDEQDGRIFRLYPTEKSLKTYKNIIKHENELLKTCFENFSASEIDEIHRLIDKMNNNLEPNWYKIKCYKEENNNGK